MEVVVETHAGRIRGREQAGLRVFRGVPYAEPPVGPRRLRVPEPVKPWTGVRDALCRGPAAPQNGGLVSRLLGIDDIHTDEDCLTLDVWAPAGDPSGRGRPVMVWIHGGSFTMGTGAEPVYDGSGLARRGDVVVVTINYRLGALGWLALPELAREEGGALGNLGLLDQIEALRFVRENAAAFGGDSDNVTVFGESAGAMSIGTLLAVPAARGLFQRAILQSGAAHNAAPEADAVEVAERFMKELGLAPGDVPGLRRAGVQAILEAQAKVLAVRGLAHRGLPFQPTVEGRHVPQPPAEALARGEGAAVPLLLGTNVDEWKLFGLADPKAQALDEAGLLRRYERIFPGDHGQRLVAGYRHARAGRASVEPRELWFAMESDRYFRLPAIRLAESQVRRGLACWKYLFTWASPALDGALGSCHALEIPFVFGLGEQSPLSHFVGEREAAGRLSGRMQAAWLAFARQGSPVSQDLPPWPGYDAERRATMVLGPDCRIESDPLGHERTLWEGLV